MGDKKSADRKVDQMKVDAEEITVEEATHRMRSTLLILMVVVLATIGLRYLVGDRD